ncbi:MAG: glutamate-1-semialdehyde-2,1-aminomutase [Firmicutes bacterium 13_1_40CM_3_65_11]|nr:MAG: glutamate-1-semialdehyde-2,1-aminomutase [Firmicutes bacterium 13_1_40CM_3_65_11]
MGSEPGGALRAPESERLFSEALESLAGGVDSPVRAFRSVGGTPRFMVSGKGAYLRDADERQYLDFCMSWGALLLGHANPAVVRAVRSAAGRGMSFGTATESEVRLAEAVKRRFPSIDLLRFVSSGTEATMSAVRVEGAYHGHADALLVKAGSGLAAASLPGSAGVPENAVKDTLVARYNDLASVEGLFRGHANRIAAVLVEPIAGNMGVVPPDPGFLDGLRRITQEFGSLLVFDEVITGFRVAPGGAQEKYGVAADVTCLGKVLGHGMPLGAYGGRRDIMECVAPLGPVYQAGTLSGNPLAMAAGLAAMERLRSELYRQLERRSGELERGLHDAADDVGVDMQVSRVGSMMGVSFQAEPVRNYRDAQAMDRGAYARFFWALLRRGVYLPPAPFESLFVSASHRSPEVEKTIDAAAAAFREVRNP